MKAEEAKRLTQLKQENGRLKKLSTAGAVVRSRVVPEGGGKEYEYRLATVLA